MERDLTTVTWAQSYTTGKNNLARDFYAPAIERAVHIDRAVGYFRSTAYLLMYEEFTEFLKDGGTVNLICSPHMNTEDIAALQAAIEDDSTSDRTAQSFLDEIDEIEATESGKLHISILGGMIRFGMAKLKVAITTEGDGIFHEKIGIIKDANDQRISFSGSANETLCGWGIKGNVESFDVFCEWEPKDISRLEGHQSSFNEVWKNHRPMVRTVDLATAIQDRLLKSAPSEPGEIERKIKAYQRIKGSHTPKTKKPDSESAWPSGRVMEPHQSAALDEWRKNNCRGILKHATGSGKTFTAINAIRDHVRLGKTAVVLVPSNLLFSGWRKELTQEIPDAIYMFAGSGHTRWKGPRRLETITKPNPGGMGRILLAIMDSAANPALLKRLMHLPDILLVADEVHSLGANSKQAVMQYGFGLRLGLSATPERFGDPEGTQLIMSFFDGVVGPEFTLLDAQKAGRLVPYHYHPIAINLTDFERENWQDLTHRIRKAYAQSPGDGRGGKVGSARFKSLLMERARIAKKAHNKVDEALRVVTQHYQSGQHWLIYCEDQFQMEEIRHELRTKGHETYGYHSSMDGDPERTIALYIETGGIMVAIRCLDEGVDIPPISHAIILASSQNPRQFIQRRGRVLRVAPDKHVAHIWDTLVMPEDLEEGDTTQDALTRSEIVRATEFADNAQNQAEASSLRRMAADMGISLDTIYPAEEDQI